MKVDSVIARKEWNAHRLKSGFESDNLLLNLMASTRPHLRPRGATSRATTIAFITLFGIATRNAAALGLIPLALALGQPGSDIQAPMSLVILTGLCSSTFLNMGVVPALLAHWGGPDASAGGTTKRETA